MRAPSNVATVAPAVNDAVGTGALASMPTTGIVS
ncbi:hypothetical protein JOF46_000879 [Paeniglutamicibacter psychrophenolicus]|uniref:Uncharacterized protein n=1 Tax=Paeniglutamicibacter psychrophenolicus TaxID=257454 RepID=A0ABS4W9T8_9MICC|nr:hypothetical protein [Paeniglutamicibacter psychrophenolicus]